MEPRVKGYMIQMTGKFILDELASKVPADILRDARQAQQMIKPTELRPRGEVVRLWHAIANAYPDEATAYAALVRTGMLIMGQATSTFLKLLLKMLTLRMFAAKFPDIWARDNPDGGYSKVELLGDKKLIIRIHEVDGYDHLAPVGVGWATFALTAIGQQDVQAKAIGWSMEKPGGPIAHVEATWR